MLAAGFIMVSIIVLFGLLGPLFVDTSLAQPLSTTPRMWSPLGNILFGTDDSGRDLLSVMVGVPLTLRIGLLAGAVGLGVGLILGFTSGYLHAV